MEVFGLKGWKLYAAGGGLLAAIFIGYRVLKTKSQVNTVIGPVVPPSKGPAVAPRKGRGHF